MRFAQLPRPLTAHQKRIIAEMKAGSKLESIDGYYTLHTARGQETIRLDTALKLVDHGLIYRDNETSIHSRRSVYALTAKALNVYRQERDEAGR